MKVLGINFGGRVMSVCEITVKHALFAAKEMGADVEFVRTIGKDIRTCTGCGACSRKKDNGENVHCVLKDDYAALEEKYLDADCIIVAAPVFSVGTTGQMKNFIDRFGAAHDRAALDEEQKKRIAAGKTGDELLDPRYFKKRYFAYINVGGAATEHWVSLGLPIMTQFSTSINGKIVGQLDAYGQGDRINPLFDDKFMHDCAELGRSLVRNYGKEYEDVDWYGEEGVCPMCHGKSMMMNHMPDVVCTTCGAKGHIKVEDGAVKIVFNPEEAKISRVTMDGLYDHYWEIEGMKKNWMAKMPTRAEWLEEAKKKYKDFDKTIEAIEKGEKVTA